VVAAGTAFGITTMATGTAHAQGTSSFTIVGMSEDSQGDAPTVQVSFTCSSPGLEVIYLTAFQDTTTAGTTGNITCTGSLQTATIDLSITSADNLTNFGTGPVQIGATARYEDTSAYPDTYTYSGAITTVQYTSTTTTNP
jgi:hypothetical protein